MQLSAVSTQRGVSLVEVVITMFIVTFGALAIVNLQTATAIAIQGSADHFQINELGQTIVEQLKADSSRAAAGDYNTEYAEPAAPATAAAEIKETIGAWKATMSRATPQGETRIECNANECSVGLKWYELSHDGATDQHFNLKTPI